MILKLQVFKNIYFQNKTKINAIKLLLERWHYADFDLLMKAGDPIFYVDEKIRQRHPRFSQKH